MLGVAVANCHEGVGDNPAKDVLGFLEYERPDLARTREFDDGGQNAAAKAATGAWRATAPRFERSRATRWRARRFRPVPTATARALFDRARRPSRTYALLILSSHNPNEHDDPNVDVHELHGPACPYRDSALLLEVLNRTTVTSPFA